MKYEVKGMTSYGVYDGDRLLGTYESEKTAELIAEALNDEVGRVTTEPEYPGKDKDEFDRAFGCPSAVSAPLYKAEQAIRNEQGSQILATVGTGATNHTESWTLNGQDKETT